MILCRSYSKQILLTLLAKYASLLKAIPFYPYTYFLRGFSIDYGKSNEMILILHECINLVSIIR